MRTLQAAACTVLALAATTAAIAADKTPPAVAAVYACRSIDNATERLACFDRASADLAKAEKNRQVNFADEDYFPKIEVKELKTTVQVARVNKAGKWLFTLPDGSVWLQTDDVPFYQDPETGDPFILRRGIIGNYKATVRKRYTIQVRQVG